MRRELSEEDEFGMNKPGSFESDPMEVETPTAVKDHPDFTFLPPHKLLEMMDRQDDDTQRAMWLQSLPVEPDASQWTFLQVQVRPDRAWLVMKELVATVCIGHGMMLAEETTNSVLFRKKVGQDSMVHGMMDAATYQNLYVAIGVLPSKLRALHIGYLVSNEQKLLGGMRTSHFSSVSEDRMKVLNRSMDNLLGALQSTLTSQLLTASYLYMTTPENTAAPGTTGADDVELDKGYISDVRKTFLREMKTNMRDLCIPLEEYAHQEEYACALLLNLLDPLLKKHNIDLNATESKQAATPNVSSPSTASVATPPAKSENRSDASRDRVVSTGKLYGEIITDMVQELWAKYKLECETKVKQKIDEKQKQVSTRVQAVQRLRARALDAIVDHPEAEVTNLKESAPGTRDDVLLYDGSCVVNNVPVRLHVTYGSIIYRTMVPLFARTTIVPFADVVQIAPSTMLGLRVVSVNLNSDHAKGLTIATGIEVDLLYQLLLEIMDAHKRDSKKPKDRRPPVPRISLQPDTPDLETLIGRQEEEEEKEGDVDDDTHTEKVTLQRLLEEPDTN